MEPESSKQIKKLFATCSNDCYGACSFLAHWDESMHEKKLISVNASKNHPYTQGVFCGKYIKRKELIYHEDRLKNPLIREGSKGTNEFKQISMKNAWNLLIKKINQIITNHGSESILGAFYSGNTGLISRKYPLRFFGAIGAITTTGGICNEGGCAGLKKIFGTYSVTNPFQLKNPQTSLIVVWNSAIIEHNIHSYILMQKAMKKGAKLVVVDWRKTKIAEKADLFIQPKIHTDNLLVILILKKLIERNSINYPFLKEYVECYNTLINTIKSKNYAKLIKKTEISKEKISQFIDFLIENRNHTVFKIGYGIQKDLYGGRVVQSIALIQIILGNIGKPGTGIIYSQSDYKRKLKNKISNEIQQKRLFKTIKTIEIISLAEELEKKKIKILFVWNFNPASSLPNQTRLRKALLRKDLFVVVLELFKTQTTRFADLVFPSKFEIETNDLITSYFIPSISLIQSGPCPYDKCLSSFDFFNKLGRDLGKSRGWNDTILKLFSYSDKKIVENCIELLGIKLKKDLLSKGYALFLEEDDVLFENYIFPTNSGKIELQNILLDFKGESENFFTKKLSKNKKFQLISPSHLRFLHSQLGEINSKYSEDFTKIFISDSDFKSLNYIPGEFVKVYNKFGNYRYKIYPMNSLPDNMALIYSGGPIFLNEDRNVNLFTADIPEELGHSGSYYAAMIRIEKSG